MEFRNPLLLLPLTVLAGVMVASSFAFSRIFHRTTWLFKRMALRPWLKPAVGAAGCGAVALGLWWALQSLGPEASHDGLSVLSMGYGYLQKILLTNADLPEGSLGALLLVLAAVAFGKMLTTSLTIGSGSPGGVFGPSMVIGGALGAVVGLLFREMMPSVVDRVDVFVILGMAAFFAAAANTPLSTLIMVTELTASYELLLPAMWVCALSYLVSRGWSIFHNQVPSRQYSAAHRSEFMIDVLQGMQVKDVISPVHSQFITVLPGMRLKDVLHLFTDTKQNCFPVVDRRGKYFGLFSLSDIRQFLHASELAEVAVAHDLAIKTRTLRSDMDLNTAVEMFAARPVEELPVTDPDNPHHIIAMLRREDLIVAYNSKLIAMRKDASEEAELP